MRAPLRVEDLDLAADELTKLIHELLLEPLVLELRQGERRHRSCRRRTLERRRGRHAESIAYHPALLRWTLRIAARHVPMMSIESDAPAAHARRVSFATCPIRIAPVDLGAVGVAEEVLAVGASLELGRARALWHVPVEPVALVQARAHQDALRSGATKHRDRGLGPPPLSAATSLQLAQLSAQPKLVEARGAHLAPRHVVAQVDSRVAKHRRVEPAELRVVHTHVDRRHEEVVGGQLEAQLENFEEDRREWRRLVARAGAPHAHRAVFDAVQSERSVFDLLPKQL